MINSSPADWSYCLSYCVGYNFVITWFLVGKPWIHIQVLASKISWSTHWDVKYCIKFTLWSVNTYWAQWAAVNPSCIHLCSAQCMLIVVAFPSLGSHTCKELYHSFINSRQFIEICYFYCYLHHLIITFNITYWDMLGYSVRSVGLTNFLSRLNVVQKETMWSLILYVVCSMCM